MSRLPTYMPTSEIGREYSNNRWSAEQHAYRDFANAPRGDSETLFRTHRENTVNVPLVIEPFPCFEQQEAFDKPPDAADIIFIFNRPMYKDHAASWDNRIHGQRSYVLTFQQLQLLLRIEWKSCVHGYLTQLVESGKLTCSDPTIVGTEATIKKLLEKDEIQLLFKVPGYVSKLFPTLSAHKTDPMIFTDMELIKEYLVGFGVCVTTMNHNQEAINQSMTTVIRGDAQVRNIWPQYDKVGTTLGIFLIRRSKYSHSEMHILPMGSRQNRVINDIKNSEDFAGYKDVEITQMCILGQVSIPSDSIITKQFLRDKQYVDTIQNRLIKITTNPDQLLKYEEIRSQNSLSSYKKNQKLSRITLHDGLY
jgi:hypothetical protein